jgi:polyferredoxin/Na+-translocating ferredoxin:NAD+ oxidoreductase RnfG subunit
MPNLVFWLMLLWLPGAAYSQPITIESIDLNTVQTVFSAADRLGEVFLEPPSRSVYKGEQLLGYAWLADEVKPMPAYSGKPITALVGINLDAEISGVNIVAHEEPILVIGITDKDLVRFTAQYQGQSAFSRVRIGASNRPGYVGVDGITGATITVMVLNRSIMVTAQAVAGHHGLPALKNQLTPSEQQLYESTPAWQQLWQERDWQLGVLLVALLFLVAILFFQDWLVVRTRLFNQVRTAYLLFTVFFIGFYSLAQLSIVNVLAFLQILFGGFTWETLLIDPFIFILWSFVAGSIILWGRGVYCGWLCPFGAIQELIHKLAEKLNLPSFEFSPMVHERLWAIKYLLLLALVGISLDSPATAAQLSEVEPFKTAIVMHFQREWGYVVYALALLLISAFNSKFYCKYLCPLGASFSFITRFRIFEWLRRRKECGRPCQTCAAQCQIGAIKPTGEIVDTECHYCLECQVTYWDEQRCAPLVDARRRRERRAKNASDRIAVQQEPN